MKTQMARCSIMLVIALLFISSCAPLPTPASPSSNAQPQQNSQSNAPSSNNSSAPNTNWEEFLTVVFLSIENEPTLITKMNPVGKL